MVKIKWLQIGIIALLSISIILTGQNLALAQKGYPIPKDKYVNDYANVLDATDIIKLRSDLNKLERETGIEGTVLTLQSIEDYETSDERLEEFATNLFNTWAIGNKEKNNGFLILVAVKDRKVRIELGSGYGNKFNQEMQRIINRKMLPAFRDEKYSQGIYNGTMATIDAVSETYEPKTETSEPTSVSIWSIVWAIIGIGGVFGGLIAFMIYDSSRHLSASQKSWQRKYRLSKRKLSKDGSWISSGGRGGKGGGSFGGGSSSGGGASGSW